MTNMIGKRSAQRALPMIDDLRFPGVELRETHISWVLLSGDQVIKIKKPVDFGFLDFSTLEKRMAACGAEVELNRRLAPDVYLGVVDITRDRSGRHAIGGDGERVDCAVLMRRLPDEDRADRLLARGELDEGHLQIAAETLARFHQLASAGPQVGQHGTAEAVAVSIRENFEQTRGQLETLLSPEEARELERWQLAMLEEHRELFADRVAARRIRDGHGDLRLDHLYFDAERNLRILDGIEFNERLRCVDVACDVAFLAMDLGVHGRTDLAERFLAFYARASGDYDLYSLVDFYESYRAFVRGKIACFLLRAPKTDVAQMPAVRQEARRHFRLALASERRSLLEPTLIAVGGLIASGKSTVAEALSRRTGAPVISSDYTRKDLLGVRPNERLTEAGFQGAYRPEASERVYDEVLRRAEVVLRSGRPVILDASFRSSADRGRLQRLSEQLDVSLRFVECRVSRATALERLALRAKDRFVVSDGRREIYDDFARQYEPIHELPPGTHHVLGTEDDLRRNIQRLAGWIPMWPDGLVD